MRRILVLMTVVALMVAMMAISALPALAVTPHRHFLTPANGVELAVGPQVCTNPETQSGFDQFHNNVHLGTPNTQAFQGDNPVSFRATLC